MGTTGWLTAVLVAALQTNADNAVEHIQQAVPVQFSAAEDAILRQMLEETYNFDDNNTTVHTLFTHRHNFEHYVERPFKKLESRFWYLTLKSPEAMRHAYQMLQAFADKQLVEAPNTESMRILTLFLIATALYRNYTNKLMQQAEKYVLSQQDDFIIDDRSC